MAVAASAHRVLKIVSPCERGPVHAGELRALIRVDQQPLLRFTPPYRHVQRLQHHIGGLSALHRAAHHAAGVQVDHDGQIGKAFLGADVGDVCHPGPVWRSHVELAIQSVVDGHGWLATIVTRPPFVADLRPDTRQPGQPGNAVRATGLAVIQQVIVLLAVAIDLAAVVPGPPDQLRLPGIFPSPLAQRALLPCIVATWLHSEAPAHCPHAKTIAMLGNERVSHFVSRAKYAVTFLRCRAPRSPGPTRASVGGSPRPCQHRKTLASPAAASTHTASAG